MRAWILLPVLAVALAGCTGQTALPNAKPGSERAVPWEMLESCTSSETEAKEVVVQSQEDLQRLWDESCQGGRGAVAIDDEPPPAPEVDFARHTVLALFWGEKRTGGFSIGIANITEKGDHVAVRVTRDSPGPGCATAQVLTYPEYLATTEKLSKAVRFDFVDREYPC